MTQFKQAVELAVAFQGKSISDPKERLCDYNKLSGSLTVAHSDRGLLIQSGIKVALESRLYSIDELHKVAKQIKQDSDICQNKKGCRIGKTTVKLSTVNNQSLYDWNVEPGEKEYIVQTERLIEVFTLLVNYVDSKNNNSMAVFKNGYVYAHDTIQMVKTALAVSDITTTDETLLEAFNGMSFVLNSDIPELLLKFCSTYSDSETITIRSGKVLQLSTVDASLTVPCLVSSSFAPDKLAPMFEQVLNGWQSTSAEALQLSYQEILQITSHVNTFSSQASPSIVFSSNKVTSLDKSVEIELEHPVKNGFCLSSKKLEKAIKTSKNGRMLTVAGQSGKIESCFIIDDSQGSVSLIKTIITH